MEKDYMMQLDGLRFFAVSGVMAGHWITYPWMIRIGPLLASCGVNLFFVLSGFLITQILLKAKLNIDNSNQFVLKQFYVRRFIRIFPLYYLVIFVGWSLKVPSEGTSFGWFLTYTTNIVCAINAGHCGYFTHLWSLAVEEQFYIIFPFIVLLIPSKKLLKTFFIIIICAIIIRLLIYLFLNSISEWGAYTLTPCCFDAFGIGAILAYLRIFQLSKLREILKNRLFFFLAVLFCLFVFFFSPNHPKLMLLLVLSHRFSFSIFCFWLIGVASFGFKNVLKYILENRLIIYLGKISYGIYIYHHFIPFFVEQWGYNEKIHSIIESTILYLTLTIIIATISWFSFEKPINGLKRFFNYNTLAKNKSYLPVNE